MVRFVSAAMLLVVFVPAYAQGRSALPINTAKGEILLEVSATGISKQKAIKISSVCYLTVAGETDEAAKRKLESTIAEMKSNASTGISYDISEPPQMITTESSERAVVQAASAAVDAAARAQSDRNIETRAVVSQDEPAAKKYEYKQKLVFSGVDAKSFAIAKNTIEESNCDEDYPLNRSPVIEISDAKGAKKQAIQIAFTNAKAQAQEYADAMGMDVAALARVSSAGEIKGFLGEELSNSLLRDITRDFAKREINPKTIEDVEVKQIITAEFILKPR